MTTRQNTAFRAIRRAQYKFDFDNAPHREHRLYAYAQSDEQLRPASSAKLRKLFEEFCEFEWYDEDHGLVRLHRLKGFQGDYWWKDGTLRFFQRGPEIPFFGITASLLCKAVPVMYSSATPDGQETEAKYFFSGEEIFEPMPPDLAAKFAALREKQWGIIRPPLGKEGRQ